MGSGDLTGQQTVPGVNTVGAIFYGDSAAFGQTPEFQESFSSVGPGTLLFDNDGNPLVAPESAGKVDFLAPDGASTTFAAPFFGTSAAVSTASAVAALMLQANPNLSTAQVTALLEQSAISLGQPAAEQGAGLIQADEAVELAEQVACYCPGTLIQTPQGEYTVETLVIGDIVVTASGADEPIRWIGRRRYTGRFLMGRPALRPIRIQAGALGGGLPRRDLLVSPMHAMFLDGVLVPTWCLANGTTIAQERTDQQVDYIHIELAGHDLILAEGAPSETFLDDGSRGMFHNADEYHALYPDVPKAGLYCAPRITSGYALEAIRQRLALVAREVTEHAARGPSRMHADRCTRTSATAIAAR